MYDILELKGKLLPELQEIGKKLNVPKLRSLKKMDLVYQILDLQAVNPNSITVNTKTATQQKEKVPQKNSEPISLSNKRLPQKKRQ